MKSCPSTGNGGKLWCTLGRGHTGMHFDASEGKWFIDQLYEWHFPPGDSKGHPYDECDERGCW